MQYPDDLDGQLDISADAAPAAARAIHLDLSRCWSCGRAGLADRDSPIGVLVVLSAPSGPYALCPACLGQDAERRPEIGALPATSVVHVKRDSFAIAAAEASGRYVYVGRPSRWGNPFTHKADTLAEHVVPVSEVLPRYEAWLRAQPALLALVGTLRGKVLGCWCAPGPCHGDVLARIADGRAPSARAARAPRARPRASSGAR